MQLLLSHTHMLFINILPQKQFQALLLHQNLVKVISKCPPPSLAQPQVLLPHQFKHSTLSTGTKYPVCLCYLKVPLLVAAKKD